MEDSLCKECTFPLIPGQLRQTSTSEFNFEEVDVHVVPLCIITTLRLYQTTNGSIVFIVCDWLISEFQFQFMWMKM